MEIEAAARRTEETGQEIKSEGEAAEMRKSWFCEECGVAMEWVNGDFCKCPSCGAEVWEEGEGGYKGDRPEAEIAQKIHGKWFCQKCREEMTPIDGAFCKCQSCGAELWYGNKNKQFEEEEIKALMEHYADDGKMTIFEAMIGGRAAKGKSGSKSKSRTRKKDQLKKPTTEELYRRLTSGR